MEPMTFAKASSRDDSLLTASDIPGTERNVVMTKLTTNDITAAILEDREELAKSEAGRLLLAMTLAAPPCVDEHGNEYTGEPMITVEQLVAIVIGKP